MQPKQIFLLIAICSLTFTATAQEYQPYKEIGKKVKVLTLSNGKYDEFFDYKDIQRIGSVMYNIRTKKIVKLLNADSIFKKFSNNSSASRWYSPDPLSDKFASLTPYNFVENNPINKIDPDGMEATDWFKDKKGVMQFDPNVKKQEDLGDRGTYVGATATEKTKNGTASFRSDGSILYTNQNDAYSRIWNNSTPQNKEQMGLILNKGVLVLPDYLNDHSTSKFKEYNYDIKDSKYKDPIDKATNKIIATIHSHFKGGGYDPTPSFDDQKIFPKVTPNTPYLTMGQDGKVYGLYGTWNKGADGQYHTADIKNNWISFKSSTTPVNNATIMKNYPLREYLQFYMTKIAK
jgi:hypothetical protein